MRTYLAGLVVSLNEYIHCRIFFSALAQGFQSDGSTGSVATHEMWSQALTSALTNLYTYTRARPPSRTLVDPLDAFINAFSAGAAKYAEAADVAVKAAENTKNLEAKAGRSAYVEGDRLKKEQIPDPGAWGVKIVFENLA